MPPWVAKISFLSWPLLTLAIFVLLTAGFHLFWNWRYKARTEGLIWRQVIMLVLILTGLISVVLSFPLRDSLRGQLLSFLGILISAAIALSSTTFLGNALAGILLRSIRSFRPGDFIRVEDFFGRISARGLFHIEIQTETRDLTTIPNLFLATHPVQVTRSAGTFIATELSLGYDVPHARIETLLKQAVQAAELKEPFVRIQSLNDFSVTYRAYGLLAEVETLLSARSRLNACTLDVLHGAGVEIVSPAFMNTRAVNEIRFLPPQEKGPPGGTPAATETPEAMVFDKAQQAAAIERQRDTLKKIELKIAELKEHVKTLGKDDALDDHKRSLARLESQRAAMGAWIEAETQRLQEETPEKA